MGRLYPVIAWLCWTASSVIRLYWGGGSEAAVPRMPNHPRTTSGSARGLGPGARRVRGVAVTGGVEGAADFVPPENFYLRVREAVGKLCLLRESMANESEWCSVMPHAMFVRERACTELTDMLDRAGIPQDRA
jgi:hypothetical protein